MPTPPRRSGKTGKTSGRTGGAPDMMARATAQASRDASALFDQLDDARLDENSAERNADVLERLAKRIRAGMWTVELAQLVAQAREVESQLADE
jgi:HPt (histidine-containing phosphotransfer) domain-containing protein